MVRPGHRAQRRQRGRAGRDYRASRSERGRQVDLHEADDRAAQAEQGDDEGARGADLGEPAPLLRDRVLPRAGFLLRADDRPGVGHRARGLERARREGGRGGRHAGARPGGSHGGRQQEDWRLQQGDATAREARAGHRARSIPADPRRAAVGHGSAGPPPHDQAYPGLGSSRQERHRLEPHPARDRVDDRQHPPHQQRPDPGRGGRAPHPGSDR